MNRSVKVGNKWKKKDELKPTDEEIKNEILKYIRKENRLPDGYENVRIQGKEIWFRVITDKSNGKDFIDRTMELKDDQFKALLDRRIAELTLKAEKESKILSDAPASEYWTFMKIVKELNELKEMIKCS